MSGTYFEMLKIKRDGWRMNGGWTDLQQNKKSIILTVDTGGGYMGAHHKILSTFL